ncbi:unnamed protein product [Ambrosiozyma monospora]|uniref:Unnamed protein product n=1 Tax=Ambrosiozyma monospora TaxID=43982 RepID=A0ACB5T240_AMBMO|nr:unnamed protein product [Ambrosiozyma monospora]
MTNDIPPPPKAKGDDDLEQEGYDDNATLVNGTSQASNLTYNRQARTLDGSTIVDGQDNTKLEGNLASFDFGEGVKNELSQSRVSQDAYNHNRISIDRLINTAGQMIKDLQRENNERPIYYPTDIVDGSSDPKLNSSKSRMALIRQTSVSEKKIEKAPTHEDGYTFELLRISLKIGPGSAGVSQSLDKSAMSQLLNEKFNHISRHLGSLKDRVDDTSSKVLVTGDLNSGKSAFCNALLKRNIMPEDQQPCTNVFCEIIDASYNNNKEEVHAIPIGKTYNKKDERTYEVYKLEELEDLVYESEKYSLLQVYVIDNRPAARSLLKNGVIDVKLIDAPGLNLDSYHTTQVFSRQEEIDLVVFVVNAENHFTLSGREFLSK